MINRMYVITLLSVLPFTACGSAQGGEKAEAPEVYFIREITPQNMVRIYEALERPATGKVAVKLSTGEPGGHNFLKPELIKDIVTKVGGTIVECNTAYGGGRARTQDHLKAAADHGFTAIAPVDIMDADGEVSLPVKGGKHLKENFVGSHYPRYDFTVVLSHFKGHAMGDIGILASLDPVALDKACVDMVYASPDPGKSHLIERMESRHGIHTLEHAEAIGLGSQQYRLVELK